MLLLQQTLLCLYYFFFFLFPVLLLLSGKQVLKHILIVKENLDVLGNPARNAA